MYIVKIWECYDNILHNKSINCNIFKDYEETNIGTYKIVYPECDFTCFKTLEKAKEFINKNKFNYKGEDNMNISSKEVLNGKYTKEEVIELICTSANWLQIEINEVDGFNELCDKFAINKNKFIDTYADSDWTCAYNWIYE